jgi:tetratricopeptide (TPR) repeat protein
LSKSLLSSLIAILLLVSIFAMTTYGGTREGASLFEAYFDATPPDGYATQRSLAATRQDEEASILRQAIIYHQQADYDLALVSLRASLDGFPMPGNAETYLLAATAATASGEYREGKQYLDLISPDDGVTFVYARWYAALLALRQEQTAEAASTLRTNQAEMMKLGLPVAALLERIEG